MIYKSYTIENNINLIKENLTLFYGENLGLKDEFKRKIKLNYKGSEIINFNQEDILKNTDKFFSEVYNISLFEEKKIFFISQTNDKILEIIKDLESKISEQKFFLFSELLDKKSKLRNYFEKSKKCSLVACYADNELTIKNIIIRELNGFEGLSVENLNLIIDSSSLDRIKLKNEIEKIISFFIDKKINNRKLELLLNLKENNDFNILKDEAFNGNKLKTNKLLSDTFLETEKNILYLNMISKRLEKLFQIFKLSESTSVENAINSIKPPIFWKDKPSMIFQAKKWNAKKIKNILKKAYNLEIQIKSSPILSKDVLIKKFLLDICDTANA